MHRRFVLLFAVTTLVLAVFPAVGSATFIPGPTGKIVFTSGRASSLIPAPAADDGDARLWVADFPFGTPAQVTTLPANTQHRHPNWSPDHSKIVYAAGVKFSGEYALWIVDLKTGAQTEFAKKAPMQDRPSWSPDGTRIAYGSEGNLWVKDADADATDSAEQLTTGGAIEERPVWSPDGNTLYYNVGPVENRDLYKKSPVSPGGAETGVLTTPGKEADDWQPALSPDGQRLCFLRGQQNDTADIWTVNVSGSGAAAFANTGGKGELNCVWSPDGTRILYTEGIFGAGEIRSRNINKGDYQLHAGYNVAAHFDGNADWATNFSPTCEAKKANVGVNSFVSITLSCTDPDSGFGKAPPTPDPLGDSSMEIAASPKNGAIGSLENGKVIYTPNKDFKGTDTFTYTGEDNESTSQPATVTIQVANPSTTTPVVLDKTAPSISALKVSVKRWRLGKGLASISKAPVGTTISFKLSEAAAATLSFQRFVPAKKGGKPRYVNAGSLKALSAKAGQNKVRFQGRLTGSRSLSLGKYRVLAKARDVAGNQSPKRTGPSFTIVNK